jgi:hypothetical protein
MSEEPMAKGVIVGPDIWALYLTGDEEASGRIEELLEAGRLRVPQPVAAEAIRRARSMEETAAMREIVAELTPPKEGRVPWLRAGELAWRLRAEGMGEPTVLDAYAALVAHSSRSILMTQEPGIVAAAGFLGVEVLGG